MKTAPDLDPVACPLLWLLDDELGGELGPDPWAATDAAFTGSLLGIDGGIKITPWALIYVLIETQQQENGKYDQSHFDI